MQSIQAAKAAGAGCAAAAPGRRVALSLATVGLILALAGCSASSAKAGKSDPRPTTPSTTSTSSGADSAPSTAGQPSGPADACRLVTPAEAQAALGHAVRAGKAKVLGPTGQGASCTYETTDFANGTAAGKALTISYFPHSTLTKAQFDQAYGANGSRAVPGLGDGAWYLGGTLNVYAHGTNLGVTIVSLTQEATADQLAPITRLALSRI